MATDSEPPLPDALRSAGMPPPANVDDAWLQRAVEEEWIVRWSVHFREEELESTDPSESDDALRPGGSKRRRIRLGMILMWVLEAIGITVLFAIFGVLVPFCIIWWGASLVDHHEGVWRSYLIFSYASMAVGTIILIGCLFSQTWWRKRSARVLGAVMAVYVLPWFMYATAAPGMMDFEVLTHRDWPEFWRWLVFYAYLFADVIALGAPEAFFGHMAALQPASWTAALNTLLIRAMMTLGAIWCIWSFLARRIRGREDFVGTAHELQEYLRGEQSDRGTLTVYAHAIEQPIAEGPKHWAADDALAALEAASPVEEEEQRTKSLNRANPLIVLSTATGSAVAMSLLLLVGFHTRGPSLFIAKVLMWIIAGVVGAFIVLLLIGFAITLWKRMRASDSEPIAPDQDDVSPTGPPGDEKSTTP